MELDPNRLTLLPTGYFGDSSDLIYTVENFLSQDEVDKLLFAARNFDIWRESSFRNKYSDKEKLKIYCPEVYQILEDIHDRWKEHVSKFYNVDIVTFINPICKWPIGGSQKPHADKEWEDGSPGDQNYYDIGSVIYINDDYDGGEVYFPDHNIEIKPNPGFAVAFPGDMFFMHGVKEIKKTERYAIPIFWTVLEYDANRDKSLLV